MRIAADLVARAGVKVVVMPANLAGSGHKLNPYADML